MERTTSLSKAKKILGKNFIGPVELKSIEDKLGIFLPDEIFNKYPEINFSEEILEKHKHEYILILGVPYYKDKTPLTIVKMREHFGWDSQKSEPCFYNQDWYLNEEFAKDSTFKLGWYLIKKKVIEEHRGKNIEQIKKIKGIKLPSAVICTYLFFVWYLFKNEILWENDFIWCEDKDHNEDQIYVGRYFDPEVVSKIGFNIHRHLKIRKYHSIAPEL